MLPAWPRSSPRTAAKHQSRGGERVALGGARSASPISAATCPAAEPAWSASSMAAWASPEPSAHDIRFAERSSAPPRCRHCLERQAHASNLVISRSASNRLKRYYRVVSVRQYPHQFIQHATRPQGASSIERAHWLHSTQQFNFFRIEIKRIRRQISTYFI